MNSLSTRGLTSRLPKVGIRPTIDGRRMGICESLEQQTMNMALNAARPIEENLRHADGSRVECVIADSIVDAAFFENCLGMRCEYVDMTELIRRINENVFDGDEFARARKWAKENCKEGVDYNPPGKQKTRQQKDAEWDL